MSDGDASPALGEEHAWAGCSDQQPSKETIKSIAIIGMSCRFPGEASSVKGLWEMCCNGRNAWSEFPKDRMNGESYWHPNTSKHGSVSTRELGQDPPLIRVAVQRKGRAFLERRCCTFRCPILQHQPERSQRTYLSPNHRQHGKLRQNSKAMDPQQRLLLEVTYEALENGE